METQKTKNSQNKRLIGILVAVPILLMIPLVAMQFTDEVKWSLSDFIIMGILLLGTGLICELVIRSVKTLKYRIVLFMTVLFLLFLVWAELAVGVFGTPFSGS